MSKFEFLQEENQNKRKVSILLSFLYLYTYMLVYILCSKTSTFWKFEGFIYIVSKIMLQLSEKL